MKAAIVAGLVGFWAALAVVIGNRLTADDMAVVLGVAVGVAASVPVSILLVALVQRAQRSTDREAGALEDAPQRARVIVAEPAAPLRLTDGPDVVE